MDVKGSMLMFSVATASRFVGTYQSFGETCLHLQALKMEAVCFSETLVSTLKSTRRHKPEEEHGQVQTSAVELTVSATRVINILLRVQNIRQGRYSDRWRGERVTISPFPAGKY
jgi:hypothetical protein